jgi:hypothetical protein
MLFIVSTDTKPYKLLAIETNSQAPQTPREPRRMKKAADGVEHPLLTLISGRKVVAFDQKH